MTSATDDRDLLDRLLRRYPPKRYRLDDYGRWFPTTAAVIRESLERFAPLADGPGRMPPRPAEPAIGVVVLPWVSTPVPWYSIMLAIGLARRGRTVVLVWDDTGFPEDDAEHQNRVIADVLADVESRIPVIRLTDCAPAAARPDDADLVETLTRQNVTWTLRGAVPTADDDALVEAIGHSLAESLPRVRAALADLDLECLVIPGGVRGTTGLFLAAAQEHGWRAATFDVDRGVAQICVDGVAAQNADIPRAFATVWGSGPDARGVAVAVGRAEFTRRTERNDRYGFQLVPSSGSADDADTIAAVILMNVDWDTAALGRHVHFADSSEWVTETVATVLAEDRGDVVVRQHPSERRPGQRSRLDIGAILRDRFGDDPRIRFVAAEDPTSTYDLLHAARLVLPFTSNVGVEAAAIGKPVVVAGACHYGGLGFVRSADSRDEYFALVRQGVRGELPTLPDQSDRAWVYYSLVAVENRVWTDFTPHPDDFWKWCRTPPAALFADPAVVDILEAIDHAVPVSVLRHRARTAGCAA